MKHAIKWTDDCSGKKDYDGRVITISTRYWPRGGGFYEITNGEFRGSDHPSRQHIRPSAKSSVCIVRLDEHGSEELLDVAEYEIECDTEEEVKRHVESWVDDQYKKITNAIASVYGVNLKEIEG